MRGCAAEEGQRRKEIVEEAVRNGFRTKAEEEDANERAIMQAYMEMVQEEEEKEQEMRGGNYVPPSRENPAGVRGAVSEDSTQRDRGRSANETQSAPAVPTHSKPPSSKAQSFRSTFATSEEPSHRTLPPPPPTTPRAPPDVWLCDICTLVNPGAYLCCDACGTERSTLSSPFAPTNPTTAHPIPPPSTTTGPTNPTPASSPPQPRQPSNSTTYTSNAAPKPKRNGVPSAPSAPPPSSSKSSKSSSSSLAALYAAERARPLGWLCERCGTFMEREWWTCARCGTVKARS